MKINLEELRTTAQQRINLQFSQLFPSAETVKPVVGDLTLWATASGVALCGNVQTLLKLSCHRCLKTFFQALELEIDERFVYRDYLNIEETELRERQLQKHDFVEALPYMGFIDISDIVYQAVILAIPVHCSCGTGCLGIDGLQNVAGLKATISGTDEPQGQIDELSKVDPRWKNLKTLFQNEE